MISSLFDLYFAKVDFTPLYMDLAGGGACILRQKCSFYYYLSTQYMDSLAYMAVDSISALQGHLAPLNYHTITFSCFYKRIHYLYAFGVPTDLNLGPVRVIARSRIKPIKPI